MTVITNNLDGEKITKIAILGTGFGGVHAALQLKKIRRKLPKSHTIQVDLISRTDYFWLVTMAHEIATGNLLPHDVSQPIRSLPVAVYDNFIQANITQINAKSNEVTMNLIDVVDDNLPGTITKKYDYIISSLGAETFFFGVEGAREHSLSLKTMADVKRIKNRLMQSFEDAELLDDVSQIVSLLHFVIVGGGPTGVEIAGEIADLIHGPLRKRFLRVIKYASITIIHGSGRLGVPGYEWMSSELESILIDDFGVKVDCNSFVTKVTPEGVYVGEKFYSSKNVIWSGGVKASGVAIVSSNSVERTKSGRVLMCSDLSLQGNKNLFIIGDQASIPDGEGGDYPMRAQFAVRQGRHAVKNIISDLLNQPRQDFEYYDKGVIISLGSGKALASVFGLRFSGWFAYWLYRTAYLPQIVGLRPKVKTVVTWTLNLFTSRDLSKL